MNVSHFEVEKSNDGKYFERFGTITFSGQNYTFRDDDAFRESESIYYRLKIVDQNSSYFYSKTIHLNKLESNFDIFPNPTNGKLSISGINIGDQIYVTNPSGMILIRALVQRDNMELDLTNFENGIYFIHQRNENSSSIYKILKL